MAAESGERVRTTEQILDARLTRLREGRVWSASGPVHDAAATEIAGFDPVGQVFAGTVVHFGYVSSRAKCTGTGAYTPRTDLATAGGPFNTLLRRHQGARRTVLARALAECEALQADGIIGARIETTQHPAGGTAITLEGTAVRARASTRPATPFTTHVDGQDLARLLSYGWMPFALVYGISIASRHENTRTWQQSRRGFGKAANREISGHSLLVNDARRDARGQLRAAVEACGGEGVVVDAMTLSISERECPSSEHERDHVAHATFAGTAIVAIGTQPAARRRSALTIMRLNPGPRPDESPAAAAPAERTTAAAATELETEATLPDRLAARMATWQRRRDTFRSDYGE
jgi:uncharacterized protein YbjQ (UPF0145 family)